jgi:hypothetical protein
MKFYCPLVLAAALAACAPTPSNVKVIVGATLLDPAGNPVMEHSVVVVDGANVRSVGPQAMVPIPAGSEKVDGAGKTVAPAAGGAIEAGKPANLVLRTGDQVERTMQNGEWLP